MLPTSATIFQWSMPIVYDNGSFSSIGINDSGMVLEVHNGPTGNNGMFYRLGAPFSSVAATSGILWYPVNSNGLGAGHPLSCDINDEYAVQVYEDDDKNLIFQWAALSPVLASGLLNWTSGDNYTSGRHPAIAINNNSNVVAVHRTSKVFNDVVWYATGAAGAAMGAASQIRQPDGSTIEGTVVRVAMNDGGVVAVAYGGSKVNYVKLIAGTLQQNGSINFGEAVAIPNIYMDAFDIALDNDGHLLMVFLAQFGGLSAPLQSACTSALVMGNNIRLGAIRSSLRFLEPTRNSLTLAMNNNGKLVAEAGAPGGPPPPLQYMFGIVEFPSGDAE